MKFQDVPFQVPKVTLPNITLNLMQMARRLEFGQVSRVSTPNVRANVQLANSHCIVQTSKGLQPPGPQLHQQH